MCVYIYISIYICVCVCVCICMAINVITIQSAPRSKHTASRLYKRPINVLQWKVAGVQTRCQRKIWQHCRISYQLHGTDCLKTGGRALSCQVTVRAYSLRRSHCNLHSARWNQFRHCHYVARVVILTGFHTALISAECPASWTTERPQFDFRQGPGLSILALRPTDHPDQCIKGAHSLQ